MGEARLRLLLRPVTTVVAATLALTISGAPVPHAATTASAAAADLALVAAGNPCPSGLVALTFDDGPRSPLTPRFFRVLHERGVPATFFVVGQRVSSEPRVLRRAASLGFTIGNHTFGHENLTRLGNGQVASTLLRTRRAIRSAGVSPSPLMRPPYGSIDGRVRGVVRDLGMVPVLWTADPRDWDGRSATSIVRSVLAQLRPGEPNTVLLHDGVDNADSTLAALPRIIRGIRGRGYCLVALDRRGRPTPPVPQVRVADASATERPGGTFLRFAVTLSRATSRATSVRVRAVAGTASAGADFAPVDRRVLFPIGVRRAVVSVPVRDDLRDERVERLHLRLGDPRGLRVRDAVAVGEIRDDDPPPRLHVSSAEVVEPGTGGLDVPVRLRLERPSAKRITVTVTTVADTAGVDDFVPTRAQVTFQPGEVAALLTVRVLADDVEEPAESFTVLARDGTNVDLTGASGVVTIVPPPAPAPAPDAPTSAG